LLNKTNGNKKTYLNQNDVCMKMRLILILFVFLTFQGYSQKVEFISCSANSSDSSFYDIKKTGTNNYWACGKFGILYELNDKGELSKINYPNKGKHLLKLDKFDDDNMIVCGEGGFVYNYCKSKNDWNVMKVKGYDKSTFYNIAVIDNNTAYICGGKSKITLGKRTVPLGFILKTADRGNTWTEVYSSAFSMIWDMDINNNQLCALSYNPFIGTKIIAKSANEKWQKKSIAYSGLYHEMFFNEGNSYFVGSYNANFQSNGMIFSSEGANSLKTKEDGLFWDIDANANYIVSTACKGIIYVNKKSESKWQRIDTKQAYNLYEIAFIDDNSFFVIGSNKLILKVNLEQGIN